MDKFAELQRRIEALEKWQKERTAQQITFPLDQRSLDILNKYFLRKLGNLDFTNASGNITRNVMVKQDGKIDVLSGYTTLFRYTAVASNDTLYIGEDIINLTRGGFANDTQVWILTTDTAPAPLSEAVPYYVVNANSDGTQIKLSTTLGGAAVNITNSGNGEQFITPFT